MAEKPHDPESDTSSKGSSLLKFKETECVKPKKEHKPFLKKVRSYKVKQIDTHHTTKERKRCPPKIIITDAEPIKEPNDAIPKNMVAPATGIGPCTTDSSDCPKYNPGLLTCTKTSRGRYRRHGTSETNCLVRKSSTESFSTDTASISSVESRIPSSDSNRRKSSAASVLTSSTSGYGTSRSSFCSFSGSEGRKLSYQSISSSLSGFGLDLGCSGSNIPQQRRKSSSLSGYSSDRSSLSDVPQTLTNPRIKSKLSDSNLEQHKRNLSETSSEPIAGQLSNGSDDECCKNLMSRKEIQSPTENILSIRPASNFFLFRETKQENLLEKIQELEPTPDTSYCSAETVVEKKDNFNTQQVGSNFHKMKIDSALNETKNRLMESLVPVHGREDSINPISQITPRNVFLRSQSVVQKVTTVDQIRIHKQTPRPKAMSVPPYIHRMNTFYSLDPHSIENMSFCPSSSSPDTSPNQTFVVKMRHKRQTPNQHKRYGATSRTIFDDDITMLKQKHDRNSEKVAVQHTHITSSGSSDSESIADIHKYKMPIEHEIFSATFDDSTIDAIEGNETLLKTRVKRHRPRHNSEPVEHSIYPYDAYFRQATEHATPSTSSNGSPIDTLRKQKYREVRSSSESQSSND